MSLDLFRKLSIQEIARKLGLKPLDIARMLGQSEAGLPRELQFSPEMVDHLREMAGIEVWWPQNTPLPISDPVEARALVRSLAHKLVEYHEKGGSSTRADNLFRGLNETNQRFIGRVVNQMIREGLIRSFSTESGLHISIDDEQAGSLTSIAAGQDIPESIAALWD